MLWSGIKLKDLRRRLGWHEADLARRLSVSMEDVKSWENEQCSIPIEVSRDLYLLEEKMNICSQRLSEAPQAEEKMISEKLE